MKKLSVTLCLIVKNEEQYVAKCIESVQPLVEDILIADTGSTDNTINICKQYANHVESIDFSNGFSAARNHLLKQVKTDWVLFLDADEYFDPSELSKFRKLILCTQSEIDAYSFLRYNFFSSGAFYTSDTIKLFRRDPQIFYTGIVVDSIKPSIIKKGGNIENAAIILNHFGHCRSIEVRNEKSLKYLEMMDRELVQNPDNHKVMGYKALILRTLGEFEEAQYWAEKALQNAPDKGHPYFVRGHVERAFNRHEQAIDSYNKAIEIDGTNPIYLNSRGIANLAQKNFEEAALDFQKGEKLFPYHVHFTINLGLVDQALGNYKEAAKRFEQVGNNYPGFLKTDFDACSSIDPYSGFIYDTVFNFRGLAYHLAFCKAMANKEFFPSKPLT